MDNQNDTKKHISAEEIEKQLHEQYAINNNNKSVLLVSFITAFLVVLAGLGKVIIDCSDYVAPAVMLADCIMFLLAYLAVSLGSSQRSDQFIIYKIRCKAYGGNYNKVFPDNYYSPMNKCWNNFVVGIYNGLFSIFMLAILLTPLGVDMFFSNEKIGVVPIIWSVALFIIGICIKANKYESYLKTCKKFKGDGDNNNSKK